MKGRDNVEDNNEMKQVVTVAVTLNVPVQDVWRYWTEPEHITKWNRASEDWHTSETVNDLREGGSFRSRMEAKDGSFGFDFSGIYDEVRQYELIVYTLSDGRKVRISFDQDDKSTVITENFEAEEENPLKLQQSGWQSILNSFKNYAEKNYQQG